MTAAADTQSARQFKLFHKLVLIVLLSNLPVLLLGYLFVTELRKDTVAAEKERAGIAYLSQAWPLFDVAVGGGDLAPQIARLEEAGATYDELLGTAPYRAAVVAAARTERTDAVAASRDFIRRIADNSGLSVDQDLSTLQAINVFTVRVPEVALAAFTVADRAGTGDDARLEPALEEFRRVERLLAANLTATDALNFEPELAARLGAAQTELGAAANRFAAAMAPSAAPADYQAALSRFWTVGVEALDRLLAIRISYLQGKLVEDLSIAAGLVVLVTLLIWLVSRSITVRLDRLGSVMQEMRRGHLEVDVPHTRQRDEIGAMARAVEAFREGLSEKRRVDEALIQHQRDLQRQNVRFDAALQHMSQGLAMFDPHGALIVCNARFAEIYGLCATDVSPGTRYQDIIARLLTAGVFSQTAVERIHAGTSPLTMAGKAADAFVELADGRVLFVSMRMMPDGGFVSTQDDITERREAEAQIAYLAHHDALTGLPNRVLFRAKLEEAAAAAGRGPPVALLHLDLDHFGGINDTVGHAVGDGLLKAVAERLRAAAGASETIARLSGDGFALLAAVDNAAAARALADRLIRVVAEPYDIMGHHLVVGASVGVALAPADGSSPEQLLRNVHMALHRAKDDGRSTCRFFEPGMDAEAQARRILELDMRKAITTGQFELHYQAQVDLDADTVVGFEALVRWRHPDRGLVAPAHFIPLAEETGLIAQIGEWVLRAACAEAATWPQDIRVAVNLSPAQFRNRHLGAAVIQALAASGLEPSRLELEITESVLLDNDEATLRTLHHLRDLGIRISMDDFGTGYSSLSYLQSFPFDKIKIDRSFIRNLETTEDSAAIVRAIAGLGASLGIATTAEGVETPAQLEIVRAAGCTEVQGYIFSPPVRAAEVWRLVEDLRGSTAARAA